MCRLAAFPPGFSREDALTILGKMEGCNRDGVGSAHVRADGRFIVFKYPGSLTNLMLQKEGPGFLEHMPYDGWTIAHLRLGTHGVVGQHNTHPFVAGEWCVAHNGIWTAYHTAKLVLGRSVRYLGETDSEVAAHVINVCGPKRFSEEHDGGVFLALNRNGQLWVIKNGGSIYRLEHNGATLWATDLSDYPESSYAQDGWYHYNRSGRKAGQCSRPEPIYASYAHFGSERWDRGSIDDGSVDYDTCSKRFGASVYEHKDVRVDAKHGKVIGVLDWFHRKVEKQIAQAAQSAHCTGAPEIVVPRDDGVLTHDDRGFPRHSPLPAMTTVTQ